MCKTYQVKLFMSPLNYHKKHVTLRNYKSKKIENILYFCRTWYRHLKHQYINVYANIVVKVNILTAWNVTDLKSYFQYKVHLLYDFWNHNTILSTDLLIYHIKTLRFNLFLSLTWFLYKPLLLGWILKSPLYVLESLMSFMQYFLIVLWDM